MQSETTDDPDDPDSYVVEAEGNLEGIPPSSPTEIFPARSPVSSPVTRTLKRPPRVNTEREAVPDSPVQDHEQECQSPPSSPGRTPQPWEATQAFSTLTSSFGGGRDRRYASSSNSLNSQHPLMSGDTNVGTCIKLVKASKICDLEFPMPRCQDLDDSFFGLPTVDDIVLAVSHAWRNQVHPDPCGETLHFIRTFASGFQSDHGRTFFFIDFLSIPQRPFQTGQADRTPEEASQFSSALQMMHNVYFYADATLHVSTELEGPEIPGEGTFYTLPSRDLQSVSMDEVGSNVRITSRASRRRLTGGSCAPFDRVVALDGLPVTSVTQLQLQIRISGTVPVQLQRLPYGHRSLIPSFDRGWIFLERFIAMTKCAMVDEDAFVDVVLAYTPGILEQIRTGADKLREAALYDSNAKGSGQISSPNCPSKLQAVLREFIAELEGKQFSGTSVDAVKGIKRSQRGDTKPHSDSEVVADIMEGFVAHLQKRWNFERSQQRRRNRNYNIGWRGVLPNMRNMPNIPHMVAMGHRARLPRLAKLTQRCKSVLSSIASFLQSCRHHGPRLGATC